jgi:hypothetical protein
VPTIEHKVSFEKVFDGISNHVKQHKVAYSLGAGIAIAGLTCLIMRSKPRPMWGGMEPMPNAGFANIASHFSSGNKTINITNVLVREGRGHPGWPVQNLETKRVFFSQKQAADAFGIGEGTLSSHLKGKFSDANGLHFERVNLTSAASIS